MSALFQSGRFEYQLPTAVGAAENDVIALQADGSLAFVTGGAGGGLTQEQVYGAGNPILEIPPVSEGSVGEVLAIGAGGILEYVAGGSGGGGLTQEQVYGPGNPVLVIPPASGGTAGQALTLDAGGLLVYADSAGGLTQADVYGAGNPILQIPPVSQGSEGEVLAIGAGGILEYVAGGGGGSGLTQEQVYGAGNPVLVIPPASSGTAGQALTLNSGGTLEYASASAPTTITVPYSMVVADGSPSITNVDFHFNNVGGNISVVIESGAAEAAAGTGAGVVFSVAGTPPVGFSAFLPQQTGTTIRIGAGAFTNIASGDTIQGDLFINDQGQVIFFTSPTFSGYVEGDIYALGFGTQPSWYGAGTYALYE